MSRIAISCPHCGQTTKLDLTRQMTVQRCDKCGVRFSSVDTGVDLPKRKRRAVALGAKAPASETEWAQRPESAGGWRPGRGAWLAVAVAAASVIGLAAWGLTRDTGRVAPVSPAAAAEASLLAGGAQAPNPAESGYAALKSRVTGGAELAKQVLTAKTVDELLPFVDDRASLEPVIRQFYQAEGKLPASFRELAPTGRHLVLQRRDLVIVSYFTEAGGERAVAFHELPGGEMRLHWPSFAVVGEIPVDDFLAKKDTEPRLMRVLAGADDYFNGDFADDGRFLCLRLEDIDQKHLFYGYLARDGAVVQQMRNISLPRKPATTPITLELRFPRNAKQPNQVEISRFICSGWIPENPDDEPANRRVRALTAPVQEK